MNTVFLLALVAYLLVFILIGVIDVKKVRSFTDYSTAGKNQGVFSVVMTLLATIVGASTTIGITDTVYRIGFPGIWWLAFGAIGLLLQSCFLSERVRGIDADTLPDLARKTVGTAAELLIALIIVVSWIGVVAGQLVAMNSLISFALGKTSVGMFVVVSLIVIAYTTVGGQLSVVRTDRLQLLLIVFAVIACAYHLYFVSGGDSREPFRHIELLNDSYRPSNLLTQFFVIGGVYFLGPDILSRNFISKDGKTARRSALVSGIAVLLFALLITLIGMWLRYNVTAEQKGAGAALMYAVSLLPNWLAILLLFGLLSAILSSTDTCIINAASILAKDILKKERVEVVRGAVLLNDTVTAMRYADSLGLLERYAEMRGTDADTIRDSIISDFGLDESGRKEWTLGGKTLTAVLNTDLTLSLSDEDGKVLKSVPKKGAEPEEFEAVNKEFAAMKKDIKAVAKTRNEKIFADFLSGRKRSGKAWKDAYLHNPLLRMLARLIVWEQEGVTFTLREDGKAYNVNGKEYSVSDKEVTVAHPMEMKKEETEAWQLYFNNNGLKQPFEQVWEPVTDASLVKPGRYDGCTIPLYMLMNKEKHGIIMEGQSQLTLKDCSAGLRLVEGHHDWVNNDFEVTDFRFKKYTRQVNHIVCHLDKGTVSGRVKKDDVTVAQWLDRFTLAQIMGFIDQAAKSNAVTQRMVSFFILLFLIIHSFHSLGDPRHHLIRDGLAGTGDVVDAVLRVENHHLVTLLSLHAGKVEHAHVHADVAHNGNLLVFDVKLAVAVT